MKTYIKSKSKSALGFRTPDSFRSSLPASTCADRQASKFGGKGRVPQTKFNRSQFHTQHKGGS